MPKFSFSILLLIINVLFLSSCTKDEQIVSHELTKVQKSLQNSIPNPTIIAHRGTTFWAPEGTEAAMRWARNAGATYLECDLQRTKDGYLVIYHDDLLTRTTDVSKKFPDRKSLPISNFTLEELFSLDLGSWFNHAKPFNARTSFNGLDILTLEDIIMIAEGFRIQRDAQHKRIYTKENGRITTLYEIDPNDNGNRPGIYPETKKPELYPNIETDLKNELERLGWYADNISLLKEIATRPGCIQTANSPARVIVQTFSKESLTNLKQAFPRLIPFCFLIGSAINEDVDSNIYEQWLNYAIENGAVIIGPCIYEKGGELGNLLKPWMSDLIKQKELLIHAYTFNTIDQIEENLELVDGFFTNQTDQLLSYLLKSGKKPVVNPLEQLPGSKILDRLGY